MAGASAAHGAKPLSGRQHAGTVPACCPLFSSLNSEPFELHPFPRAESAELADTLSRVREAGRMRCHVEHLRLYTLLRSLSPPPQPPDLFCSGGHLKTIQRYSPQHLRGVIWGPDLICNSFFDLTGGYKFDVRTPCLYYIRLDICIMV